MIPLLPCCLVFDVLSCPPSSFALLLLVTLLPKGEVLLEAKDLWYGAAVALPLIYVATLVRASRVATGLVTALCIIFIVGFPGLTTPGKRMGAGTVPLVLTVGTINI